MSHIFIKFYVTKSILRWTIIIYNKKYGKDKEIVY